MTTGVGSRGGVMTGGVVVLFLLQLKIMDVNSTQIVNLIKSFSKSVA